MSRMTVLKPIPDVEIICVHQPSAHSTYVDKPPNANARFTSHQSQLEFGETPSLYVGGTYAWDGKIGAKEQGRVVVHRGRSIVV